MVSDHSLGVHFGHACAVGGIAVLPEAFAEPQMVWSTRTTGSVGTSTLATGAVRLSLAGLGLGLGGWRSLTAAGSPNYHFA